MEFGEKLQELRKSKNLTQEELAEALYVSRTAISKWESGRGYPSIDSLKEISCFFGVTIDHLLSSDKLIAIAEKENKSNIRKIHDLFFGITDIFAVLLIILPLYPNPIDNYVFSINLLAYTGGFEFSSVIHWVFFISLIILGIVKGILSQTSYNRVQAIMEYASLAIGILTVIFLALAREAYAIVVAFLLLVIKALLLIKR